MLNSQSFKEVYTFWTDMYGVEYDIIQDPYGIVVEIIITDEGEEITYSIDDDKELQQGAEYFYPERYAKCYRGRLSEAN